MATLNRYRLVTLPLWLIGLGIAAHGLLWLFAAEPWLLDQEANEVLLQTSYEALLAAPANVHLHDYLLGLYRFFGWWITLIGVLVITFLWGADMRRHRARRALLATLLIAIVGLAVLQLRFIPSSPFLYTTAILALSWLISATAALDWPRDERAVWDELAQSYDQSIRLFEGRYPAVRERLNEDLAGATRVLEVAAGTGLFTGSLIASGRSVMTTDFSSKMIQRLRSRLSREGIDGVEYQVEDAMALSFADHSFDAVVCANGLHIMPSAADALREMHRVLQPGGILIAPTFAHGSTSQARWISRLLSTLSSFRAHSRFNTTSFSDSLVDAGFSVQRLETIPGPLPMIYAVATSE